MTRVRFWAGAVLASALVAAGCSKSPPGIVPVEGVVTINGKPLPNAEVQFVPMIQGFGGEYIATGTTDDNGRFKLTCNGQDGACACENKVTVTDPLTPEKLRGQSAEAQAAVAKFKASLKNRPIPEVYWNLAQSPLSVKVSADRKDYELELKR
jgi:hypothetical protein